MSDRLYSYNSTNSHNAKVPISSFGNFSTKSTNLYGWHVKRDSKRKQIHVISSVKCVQKYGTFKRGPTKTKAKNLNI